MKKSNIFKDFGRDMHYGISPSVPKKNSGGKKKPALYRLYHGGRMVCGPASYIICRARMNSMIANEYASRDNFKFKKET